MFLCDLLGKSGVLMELVHYDVVFVCVCVICWIYRTMMQFFLCDLFDLSYIYGVCALCCIFFLCIGEDWDSYRICLVCSTFSFVIYWRTLLKFVHCFVLLLV